MNTHVSYPTAILLQDKSINIYSEYRYTDFNGIERLEKNASEIFPYAPTIAEVVMWLYKKHLLWVYARKDGGWWSPVIENYYDEDEQGTIIENLEEMPKICFNSPTEAYEAAIEHILTELIK